MGGIVYTKVNDFCSLDGVVVVRLGSQKSSRLASLVPLARIWYVRDVGLNLALGTSSVASQKMTS